MDKRLVTLLSVLFLAVTIFISMVIFREPISQVTRASGKYTEVSKEKSKIIYWPMRVKSDGMSYCEIKVFLVSQKGAPITNKKLSLTTTLGNFLQSAELMKATDTKTYYLYQLSSDKPGIAQITAVIDNSVTLPQKISVEFTN
jgi:hypothetical protein